MISDRTIDELKRRGELDKNRLDRKIREHLRHNIKKYILEEALITGKGNNKVKIKMKSLQLPEFRFGDNDNTGLGSGQGQGKGQGQGQKALGQPQPGDQPGQGEDGAGEGSADHAIEVEIDIDLIVDLAFKELGLPDIEDSIPDNMMAETLQFDEIRKCGPVARLDRRRTLINNIKRNAQLGTPGVGNIQRSDLRFKTFEEKLERSNKALILAMMDVSGSMGEDKKFLVRVTLWWIKRYLEKIYDGLAFEFIIHDTKAQVVNEEKFFKSSTGGGTAISSALALGLELLNTKYDPCAWNIYAFQFTDGENQDADNPKALDLLKNLMDISRRVYYGQVGHPTGLHFLQYLERNLDDWKNFTAAEIKGKDDVADAIEKFLHKKGRSD